MIAPARRGLFSVILLGLALALSVPRLAVAQIPYISVPTSEPRYAAIVMDARSGEILYDKRADSPRYPASLTKIMTLYLAFEALSAGRLHPNDIIVVSPLAAAQGPTKLGLRAGQTISVDLAMQAIAVESANDMAVALAEKIGGTESRFADMMTLKAQQLGMTNTRYVNANGLPDNRQVSSAHDIAILARAVLRDFPQYYGYFSQETFSYDGRSVRNHNGLLGRMPGVDGLKTGFTNAAGYNLAASAVRNGHRLITVVMGGSSGAWRNENVESLLLTGFDVEERRDRGERIVLAQNLFEAPTGTYLAAPYRLQIRPQEAQGDSSDDPIDVVLTGATTRPASMTVAATVPAPSRAFVVANLDRRSAIAAREPQHAAAPSRSWWVQVGEFRSQRLARQQVEQVARRFARQFDGAEGRVDRGSRTFRARFAGFGQTAAEQACQDVRRRGVSCSVGEGA